LSKQSEWIAVLGQTAAVLMALNSLAQTALQFAQLFT